MNTQYNNNMEPKIGDKVRFRSEGQNGDVYMVTSVRGGRIGNKVGVVPMNHRDVPMSTFSREYYYYCFERA